MIVYKIGNINCKISWIDFLSLETTKSHLKSYKSDFKNFAELYEFIDKHINVITVLSFDNLEYKLGNGVLHNLYGPAIIKHTQESNSLYTGTSRRFFINGKLVFVLPSIGIPTNISERRQEGECTKIEDFLNDEIYFHEEISFKRTNFKATPSYRRKEGIDYKKHYINLEELKKIDLRKKKLKKIL